MSDYFVMGATAFAISLFFSGMSGSGPGYTVARGLIIGGSLSAGYVIARYFHG